MLKHRLAENEQARQTARHTIKSSYCKYADKSTTPNGKTPMRRSSKVKILLIAAVAAMAICSVAGAFLVFGDDETLSIPPEKSEQKHSKLRSRLAEIIYLVDSDEITAQAGTWRRPV